MGLLKRLFGPGSRSGEGREEEGGERPSLPVPDWVPRDVEEGFVKVRLFLSPAGRVPSLYEIELPENGEPEPGVLRCFSPPPESRAPEGGTARKAWKVEVAAPQVEELREIAGGISLFPMGAALPSDQAATVELSLTGGQAEARIRWWMSPPREWTDVDRLVSRLRELAEGDARDS